MYSVWQWLYIRFFRDIFGPFSKLRKVTASFVVSDRIEQFGFHWPVFHGFACLKIFLNLCRKSRFLSNITELPVLYVKTNLVQ